MAKQRDLGVSKEPYHLIMTILDYFAFVRRLAWILNAWLSFKH